MASADIPVTSTAIPSRYPAVTRQAAGMINGVHTDVMSIAFADKIVVTLTQGGRLAQWVHVPLEVSTSSLSGLHLENDEENGLLPLPHLTATTMLGGTMPERQTMGQLLATQIASAVATKNPHETRALVLGLGLGKVESDRDVFFQIIDLILKCL